MMTDNDRNTKIQWIRCVQGGQGKVEYALLLALIVVIVIGILTVLGGGVGNVYSTVRDALVSEESEPAMSLTITIPPLRLGHTHSWSEPALVDWLNNQGEPGYEPGSFAHPFRGQLPNAPEGAIIDPSIHTNAWWDQPDGKVNEDGSWETTVYLDARYRDPTIIRIEVKVSGETVATYETYINP